MKIQVLGTGCPKCRQLTEQAQEAVQRLGRSDIQVEKITEMDEILAFGVMMTPALAVDGKVRASGRVLSADEIIQLLQEQDA